mgnify:CR=1 FL=1
MFAFRVNLPKTLRLSTKGAIQELCTLSHSQSTAASGASQSGVRPAARNHPSTRTGDQDDVSYKQTPSKKLASRPSPSVTGRSLCVLVTLLFVSGSYFAFRSHRIYKQMVVPMRPPGEQNVCTPCGSIFKLPRVSQRPYTQNK